MWGLVIGAVAWVMLKYAGIDGIKTAAILGGAPALFLILLVMVGAVKKAINPDKYLLPKDEGENTDGPVTGAGQAKT